MNNDKRNIKMILNNRSNFKKLSKDYYEWAVHNKAEYK